MLSLAVANLSDSPGENENSLNDHNQAAFELLLTVQEMADKRLGEYDSHSHLPSVVG